MKRDQLKILMIGLFTIGLILLVDDLGLHFLGDLSWMDGYNPYTHHWMVGALMIMISFWIYKKKRIRI